MTHNYPEPIVVKFSKLSHKSLYLSSHKYFPVEFHISRDARDKYNFNESIFASTGNVIIANFNAARQFAEKMNEKLDLLQNPEKAVRAGDINAMGLIDEILHMVMQLYREEVQPTTLTDAISWLQNKIGKESLDKTLFNFIQEFPPIDVYKNNKDIESYLLQETNGIPNRQIALEEMIMLWLANLNPAFSPFLELFDDSKLEQQTNYLNVMHNLHEFFETQPKFGPDDKNLIDLLRMPAIECPDSLSVQLDYIQKNWGMILIKLKDILGRRLLLAMDLVREEQKARFDPSLGPAPTQIVDYSGIDEEPERFSQDLHWMPQVVLIAKSTLVWLDQLSKKYQRHIYRLDHIPDVELDKLARWGFTGLWLIGIWERSKASKRIKQLCGNPEAEASAYSLYDYNIAHELGSEEAYRNLRDRCWERGIRLASDMVPNHMAIDSKWVIEHPEWFVQLDYAPYPAYTYNGTNLSDVSGIGIYVEDHYYDRTDAAVTLKRVEFSTGNTKYIYHGNDGTSTPWNDTAQLNYLNSEVREAVIQTILDVARMFPIIRFDAAMTLAKKHYQRLWFPEPGSGGDIPSRAEHGLTKPEFNEMFPVEFWREVVDRIAVEAPDTLLLAEAFWLMEGYFVRTLGMHRVYNSAFMNMLRSEENKKYRYTIKNTLEFNPEILKRYVNFMNNPDEDTAIDQFGEGDKYFGICTMMVTMPGLPMIGHGQVEGFHEKYGMEYRKAYYDETENQYLIERHEREIFPLMKKRYLFAEVENFLLYDFFTPNGNVDENVFAYSNRFEEQKALIVYHNVFGNTWGWIRSSVAYSVKTGDGNQQLVQKQIGEGLGLPNEGNYYCVFQDQVTGLEYIRNCEKIWEKGLYLELPAYQYHVFMNFRIAKDNEWQHYAHLASHLEGKGTHNIEEALMEVYLKPIHHHFRQLMNPHVINKINNENQNSKLHNQLIHDMSLIYREFLKVSKRYTAGEGNEEHIQTYFSNYLNAILQLDKLQDRFPMPRSTKYKSAITFLKKRIYGNTDFIPVIWSWLHIHNLGKLNKDENFESQSRSYIDEWLLGKILIQVLNQIGMDEQQSGHYLSLLKILVIYQKWFKLNVPKTNCEYHLLSRLFNDSEIQQFLQINRYNEVLWYNKESFEQLMLYLFIVSVLDSTSEPGRDGIEIAKEISSRFGIINKWLEAEKKSKYQVEKLLEGLKKKKKKSTRKKG